MIKNLAYFPSQCALNSAPVMQAVLDSARQHGINCEPNSLTSDAVVIWSVLWHGRMKPNQQIYQHYRDRGCPVIIIEVGALKRNQTWRISVNYTTRQGYYGHEQNLDWDRPKKLHMVLGNAKAVRPTVVIALQNIYSQQVQNINNMRDWLVQTVKNIRQHTDRSIAVRPHPRSRWPLPPLPVGVSVEHPRQIAKTYDDFDLRYDCHAVVNYNSGPGVQAALAGIRPIVDESSLAWPVACCLESIELPYSVDRQQWLVEICHTEYTVEEIAQGLWLKRLGPALES